MITWQGLLDQVGITIGDIKERLSLEWVCQEANVYLERHEDGRLVGLCPFHLDESPSFAIFGEDHERCGCWSCDFQTGDVLDFIARWRDLNFKETVVEAIRLLRELESQDWVPAEPPPRTQVDPEALAVAARQAWLHARDLGTHAIVSLLVAKGLPIPASWLWEEFNVGVIGQDAVVIPHLVLDDTGVAHVTGYKTRWGVNHPYGAQGSRYLDLYGAWRDGGLVNVILCEGETDTWRVAYEYRGVADVFGLPSGANQPPRDEWLGRFKGRRVTIIFDGDRPGRAAARAWHDRLVTVADEVRVTGLEDGTDACDQVDLRGVLSAAVVVPLWTGGVTPSTDGTHYVRVASGQPICNWALRGDRLITLDEGGYAVEGRLSDGTETVITSHDLATEGSIRRWSNERGRSWLGSTKDTQSLLELMLRDGPFMARGLGTRIMGWHHGNIVLPTHVVGPEHWVYVPPSTGVGDLDLVGADDDSFDAASVTALLALHRGEVIGPILAWMAAAPLRSMLDVFPPLAVVGGSGAGKTTLLSRVLEVFGWSGREWNLTGTTPYGVVSLVSASNGVPIWFDEYRYGTRKDTKEIMDQALRDAWSGSAMARGGIGQDWSRVNVFPVLAPVIVSGEDSFTETSHLERLLLVRIPQEGRNVGALRATVGLRLGNAYLDWVVARHWAGDLEVPRVGGAVSRREARETVIAWGWELWRRFVGELVGVDAGALDMSRVRDVAEEGTVDPILDTVAWGLDERDGQGRPLVWLEENEVSGWDVVVRVRALVAAAREARVTLPGGERAVTDWLREWVGDEAGLGGGTGVRALVGRGRYGRQLRLVGAAGRLAESVSDLAILDEHGGKGA